MFGCSFFLYVFDFSSGLASYASYLQHLWCLALCVLDLTLGHRYTDMIRWSFLHKYSCQHIHSFTKQLVTLQLFSVFESSIKSMTQLHNETWRRLSLLRLTFVFLERSKSGLSLTLKIAFNVSVAILVDSVCGLHRTRACVWFGRALYEWIDGAAGLPGAAEWGENGTRRVSYTWLFALFLRSWPCNGPSRQIMRALLTLQGCVCMFVYLQVHPLLTGKTTDQNHCKAWYFWRYTTVVALATTRLFPTSPS